jgi:predicted ArsR family transcriptional regulator
MISDLITEHGSANILRERLEQIRSQLAPLESENSQLKTRVRELEEVVRGLTQELRGKAKNDNLPGDAERILLRFFKYNDTRTDEQIAGLFKLHPNVATHYMEILRERQLIESRDWVRFAESGPEVMKISAEGRRYIMDHGLHSHLDTV